MLLVTSSSAPGEERSLMLIKYFLLMVAEKVKQEQGGTLPDFQSGNRTPRSPESFSGVLPPLQPETNASFASVGSTHSQAHHHLHHDMAASPLPQGCATGTSQQQYQQQQHSARPQVPALSNFSFARTPLNPPGGSGFNNNTSSSTLTDVFYFNVSHFTELVVDMISINVLDLPTANKYFLSLLVLCQSWPSRYIDQLSGQVLRSCVAVLNRPSIQDVSVGLIETIYTLSTLVLRKGYFLKGAIESLFRVLYRVYALFPPVWMSEADAQRRKDLIVLIFRHIMRTYAGTKALQKALQVRTLTQRFSLYNDFMTVLVEPESDSEACTAFGKYCEENATSMNTFMAGRPKRKADFALKESIRIRGEYIKRVKAFNANYLAAVAIPDGRRSSDLRVQFHSNFTSYAANTPVMEASQLHWLTANMCVMKDKKVETTGGPVIVEASDPTQIRHYLDAQRNYATVTYTRRHAEDADATDVLRATLCEEQVNHIAVLVPPFTMRCRPFLCETPPPFIHVNVKLTPSAVTLLRLLLEPNETLRFISNAFRINGIHSTPCLVLLTDTTLKVISFSRLTQSGDIVLCEYDSAGTDADASSGANSTTGLGSPSSSAVDLDEAGYNSGSGNAVSSPNRAGGRSRKHNAFSFSSVTKQLQRLLRDDEREKRKRQLVRDGTRVAQSVRQATSLTYVQLFWVYMTCTIREVRSLHYMHLDTAVLISTNHDDGPMLSFVDATQSMNPAARGEFLTVLKDVLKNRQCSFVEDSQRPASLRTMLVRWATGAISNYEYLSFLNRVAGRTTKDFNQYPVFPWVLRDYSSATLDLEDANTFRDLAYPMGAQTEARRDTVTQFYQNTIEMWQASDEAQEEGAVCFPFHHGTHYSASAAVLYYLLRVEPFTTFAKIFQGGDFDIATRLFDSVEASFSSCVLGPADCKELLPEFYYNNMFLANADGLDLGTKSNGEVVDDVKLPPWAKGSVQVFTAVMRYALESDFVTHHINQWVDLVFGVRRRGPLAVERFNVFQRMTYGEEVKKAIKNAASPHDMDVIIAEVDNFGQTPMQLFQERHPSRRELEPVVTASTASSDASAGAAGHLSVTINSLFFSLTSAMGSAADKGTPSPGSTSANLANAAASGSQSTGVTYTTTFNKAAPKVMRMLVHALDTPVVRFRLSDVPASLMLPMSSAQQTSIVECFGGEDRAVVSFACVNAGTATAAAASSSAPGYSAAAAAAGAAATSGGTAAAATAASMRVVCGLRRMVPVDDEEHFICWHERESRLMRFSVATGAFMSLIPFEWPEDSGQAITAVHASTHESLVLVAVSTGTIYCLYPDTGDRVLHLNATLCYHTHPVVGFAVDSHFGRVITFTRSAEDMPIVWRVQRFHSSKLYRLDLATLVPCLQKQQEPTSPRPRRGGAPQRSVGFAETPATDLTPVHACIDHASAFSVVITKRSLFVFDNNGEPFGAGSLPVPTSPRPRDLHPRTFPGRHSNESSTTTNSTAPAVPPPLLEEEDGEMAYATEKSVPFTANMTVVLAYHTLEWASGMQLYITGHQDGSLSLWRSTRLPPDTVEPGRVALVDFHATAWQGSTGSGMGSGDANLGAVTAIHQERVDVPRFLVGFQSGAAKVFSFEDGPLAEPDAKRRS